MATEPMSPNIFITGLFRSGTTLVSRALSVHKSVDIYYQPFTDFFKYTFDRFLKSKGQLKTLPMGDPFIFDNLFDEFRDDILATDFEDSNIHEIKKKVLKAYDVDSVEKSIKAGSAFNNAAGSTFEQFFLSAMINLQEISTQNAPVLAGIKEIWCEDFIPAFLNQDRFPIKCIHIIRDPRAITASRNYGNYFEKGCNGQKYPILFISRSWRRSINIYKKMLGQKGYFPLIYENFVQDPEKVMRQVCDFLNIDFDNDMINFKKFKGGDGQPWKGNTDSRQFSSISADRNDKWKNILSEDEIFLIEFLCMSEMEALGYKFVTNKMDTERFIALQEDQNAVKSWLSKHNHCLNSIEKKKELHNKGIFIENKC